MIYYYQNPKTRDLILYDPDAGKIFVLTRIEKVRVMVGYEVQQGDFESEPRGPSNYDPEGAGKSHKKTVRAACANRHVAPSALLPDMAAHGALTSAIPAMPQSKIDAVV